MAAFLGMRGSGSFVADQRPKSYREMILMLYPNGAAPLTALMSKMASESVNDPEFIWWTKGLPSQRATVTGVYTASNLSTPISAAGSAAAATVYVKMSAADAGQFVAGKQVLLRLSTDSRQDTVGKVTVAPTINGASSYLTVKLLEADDNGSGTHVGNTDTILIIGSVHEEGADRPVAVAADPTKVYNYTQIFRNALKMTRTAQKTRLRTGDAYKEAKRECLELHSIEMEKAFLFGVASEVTGTGGFPERTTMGLINFIKTYALANCDDFALNTDFTGGKWTDGSGEDWLDNYLEQIFRYGSSEKLAYCGSKAMLGISKLVKNKGEFQFTPATKSYGIQVMDWQTSFGVIHLKTHPLFSYETTNQNSLLIFEPKDLKYRFIDDTMFKADETQTKGGNAGTDAKQEEFLTEAGLEMHFPEACGYLNGVGADSSL